ncbi:signal peptidase I [Nesterenkonia flava]|uniref:Signal peptidase I n=1 Tax=Nesterenkonia flava TaxID=469799 RepID=A0ABU1FST1_9MICC|nr:signal peptidase I [Nesterenkonia flava]MDR5711704.1 signal peptidase I [Nesterenkonia flava]
MLLVVGVVVLAALLSTALRLFVVDIYRVNQVSMEPTLIDSERIAVQKQRPDEGYQRGDIIVFDGEGSFTAYRGSDQWLTRAAERVGHWVGATSPSGVYVKRVIGVGGDRVACCDDQGRLLINGEPLEETYLAEPASSEAPASDLPFDVEVPKGRVWVMGDNREESVDSRALLGAPGGGMISEDRIIGRATSVVWPVNERRSLDEG